MEILLFAAGPVVGGFAVWAWTAAQVLDMRSKLRAARDEAIQYRRERKEAVDELGFARAQIEADAKYVDLGKRRAATRARSNAKERAKTAAKRAGKAA
jgi:hypothetical protein